MFVTARKRAWDNNKEELMREEKLIGCRRVYGASAAFSLSHHGRPMTLTHARRGPMCFLVSACTLIKLQVKKRLWLTIQSRDQHDAINNLVFYYV
ncbi:hypothetical protein QL285_011820 [Trifolium repens]|nr:hypothetical protein QL285_011820 [Trifolium repens]